MLQPNLFAPLYKLQVGWGWQHFNSSFTFSCGVNIDAWIIHDVILVYQSDYDWSRLQIGGVVGVKIVVYCSKGVGCHSKSNHEGQKEHFWKEKKKHYIDILECIIDIYSLFNFPLFHLIKDTTIAFQYLRIDLRLGIQLVEHSNLLPEIKYHCETKQKNE